MTEGCLRYFYLYMGYKNGMVGTPAPGMGIIDCSVAHIVPLSRGDIHLGLSDLLTYLGHQGRGVTAHSDRRALKALNGLWEGKLVLSFSLSNLFISMSTTELLISLEFKKNE